MKGIGRCMAREHYEALIRDIPDLYILTAWVDDFYESIKKWKEKGHSQGRDLYARADRKYYQIIGFIEAMYAFEMIDNERRMQLEDEFLEAFKT